MPQRHVKASRVGASWAEGLNSYSNGGRRQATVYLEHMIQFADCEHVVVASWSMIIINVTVAAAAHRPASTSSDRVRCCETCCRHWYRGSRRSASGSFSCKRGKTWTRRLEGIR